MIFRALSANFVAMVLPLILVAAGVTLVIKSRGATNVSNAKFYTGIFLLSLPLGVIVYIVSGIIAAHVRGDGHFYSVPFGGYTVSNNAALITSTVIWIAVVFFCLAAILRPRR